jgi:hypothetical protein
VKAAATAGRFPPRVVAAIRQGQILGIRAGTRPHRIIGIWAVVVEGRVFVRSWSLKPRSWWRTFREEPRGVIDVDGRRIAVRAIQTRSDRLKDAVSRAYMEKFGGGGMVRFARDLGRARSRATTTELVPLHGGSGGKRRSRGKPPGAARRDSLPAAALGGLGGEAAKPR